MVYNEGEVMLVLGVPDKYAMQRMGHATTTMLKTVYQHLMEDKSDEVGKAIADRMSQIFSPTQHEMQHNEPQTVDMPNVSKGSNP